MTETPADTFEVRNFAGFLAKWAELAKRAERTGVQIGYEVLSDEIEMVDDTPERVVTVQVWGETPMFSGYSLVAVVDDLNEQMRQVRGVPGHEADLPDSLWTTDAHCDHCGYDRQRNTVMVLADEAGELTQVGSTCIKDFLGGHSPEDVAWMSGWLPELAEANEEDYEGTSGWERSWNAKQFLDTVVAVIEIDGWCSRGEARDSGY